MNWIRTLDFQRWMRALVALLVVFQTGVCLAGDLPTSSDPSPVTQTQLERLGLSAIEWAQLPDGIKIAIRTENNDTIELEHHLLNPERLPEQFKSATPRSAYAQALRTLRELKSQGVKVRMVVHAPLVDHPAQMNRGLSGYVNAAQKIADEFHLILPPEAYAVSEPQPVLKPTGAEIRSGWIMASFNGVREAFVWSLAAGALTGGVTATLSSGFVNTFGSFATAWPVISAAMAAFVLEFIFIGLRVPVHHFFRLGDDAIRNVSGRHLGRVVGDRFTGVVSESLVSAKKFVLGLALTMVTSSVFLALGDFLNHSDPAVFGYDPAFRPFLFGQHGLLELTTENIWYATSRMFEASWYFNTIGIAAIALVNEEGRGTLTRRGANRLQIGITLLQNMLITMNIIRLFPSLFTPITELFMVLGFGSVFVKWVYLGYIFRGGELRYDFQGRLVNRSRRVLKLGGELHDVLTLVGRQSARRAYTLAPTLENKLRYIQSIRKWVVHYEVEGASIDVVEGTLRVRDPAESGQRARYSGYKFENGHIDLLSETEGRMLWDTVYLNLAERYQDLAVVLEDIDTTFKTSSVFDIDGHVVNFFNAMHDAFWRAKAVLMREKFQHIHPECLH